MNVTGETMIFANEVNGRRIYSRAISWHPYRDGKVDKGSWERIYETVNLPKNVSLENRTRIRVLDGYESGYKKKNGDIERVLVVKEFEIIDEQQSQVDEFQAINERVPF